MNAGHIGRAPTGRPIQVPCCVDTCTHLDTLSEPNPVVDVLQPVNFALPELLQASIVIACVGDNPGRSSPLRTRCSLSDVFFAAAIKIETAAVINSASERVDESSGRVIV